MERANRFCTNCGSEIDVGAKFCAQCGTRTRQAEPQAARETGRQPRIEEIPAEQRVEKSPPKEEAQPAREVGKQLTKEEPAPEVSEIEKQPPKGSAPESADVDWSKYSRFLKVNTSGGFSAVFTPIMLWTATAGIIIWAVLGLISLRFDLSFLNLQDLFFTMVIIIGIMLSILANAHLTLSYRNRAGVLWQVLSYVPVVWAAFLSVGLSLMIWQVWTDFGGGPNELRRAMFSLIGVGVCGVYGGYLSLVEIGPNRIYLVVRRVVYVLIAITAVEILDSLWWGTGNVTGAEMWEHFLRAGGTALMCFIVYSLIGFFMAQARGGKTQTSMLIAYLILGLIGFTIAVGALWDSFPPGAIRFVHGAIVLVVVATVGLLLVRHYHRKRDTGSRPSGSERGAGQSMPGAVT